MSDALNTVSLIGDEELCARIIGRTIEKFRTNKEIHFADYAFGGCRSLTALILSGATVCKLGGSQALTNTPIATGTGYIYVPRALVDSYKSATNWSARAAQIRALEDYTVDGTITGELDETKI